MNRTTFQPERKSSYRWVTMAAIGLALLSAVPAAEIAGRFQEGSSASPDTVRLTGEGKGDTVVLHVMLSGPTKSRDIYSFAFDLEIGDPELAQYVKGSAVVGPALQIVERQQPQVLAVQYGKRVTVGVTKLGGGPGNGVAEGEAAVVSLTFRLLGAGSSTVRIAGTQPAVIDSSGSKIPGIRFDRSESILSGS